jgi:two-component sensor histidine kinase
LQTGISLFVARIRDAFSSAVLGTTTLEAPTELEYRLALSTRLTIAATAVVIATGLAFLIQPFAGPFAILFLFPALMVTSIVSGPVIAAPVTILFVVLAALFFADDMQTVFFAVAALIQFAFATVLRQLFQESRRWGLRYRKLVSAIATATAVSDSEARIERPQPELGRLLGMAWPSYGDRGWFAAVHPDDQMKLLPPRPYRDVTLHRAEIRLRQPETGDWRWHMLRGTPLLGTDGEVEEWVMILTDIHARKLDQDQRDIVFGEMRHRFKNLMTIIQSLATSSQSQGDPGAKEFLDKFLGRLHALTAAADQVIANERSVIEAGAVIRETLAPFLGEATASRITIDGPSFLLSEQTGGLIALGMHELATNAIKYGALSNATGTVRVTWQTEDKADGEHVLFEWTEEGGPPALRTNREGFGTRVIRFVPSHERNGNVEIDYRREGLICRIRFVQNKVSAPAEGTE